MTKDELKAAAAFEPYSAPRPAVSQNPASPSPMGTTPPRPASKE